MCRNLVRGGGLSPTPCNREEGSTVRKEGGRERRNLTNAHELAIPTSH